jgi:hypothetical protein
LDTQPHLNQARLAWTQKGESKRRSLSLTIGLSVLGETALARAIWLSTFLFIDQPEHQYASQSAFSGRSSTPWRQVATGTEFSQDMI